MIKNINVIGSGVMGTQIISLFYLIGYKVNVFYNKNKNEKLIKFNNKLLLKNFSFSNYGEISFHSDLNTISNYLTIESVNENLEIKKNIFDILLNKKISRLYSNTSSIDLSLINNSINLLHFMNPIFLKVFEFTDYKREFKKTDIFYDLNRLDFNYLELSNTKNFGINKIIFSEISEFFKMIELDNHNAENLNLFYLRVKNIDIVNLVDKIGVDICHEILINLSKYNNNIYIPKCFKKALLSNILGKKNKTSIKNIIFK